MFFYLSSYHALSFPIFFLHLRNNPRTIQLWRNCGCRPYGQTAGVGSQETIDRFCSLGSRLPLDGAIACRDRNVRIDRPLSCLLCVKYEKVEMQELTLLFINARLPQYEASHEYDRQRRNEAHQDRRNNNSTTTNFHGAQQPHGHHPSGRHGASLPAGGGGNGGSAAPYRGHGNNGGGGYNPDDRRGDKPRGGHPPPSASAAPPPAATSYRPIPLPPKPQAAAVPPAAPPVTNPIPTRRP